MSRIGKQPISIPDKVKVELSGTTVKVSGPLGKAEQRFSGVTIKSDGKTIEVAQDGGGRQGRAAWGLCRTLIHNMVVGVSQGYTRTLEVNGVGYRAEVKGNTLDLVLGKSHPVIFQLPEGVTAEVEKQTIIKLSGPDKAVLGQAAAKIRSFRPPEPYKGKGVKYSDEHIRRKVGKAAK